LKLLPVKSPYVISY